MRRSLYEFAESVRMAWAQIQANKLRSTLTALGVIIGIMAVTLMGTAINGIDRGFQKSLDMLGNDRLFVQKWPWHPVTDWWNYVNRPPFTLEQVDRLNRVIAATPDSLLKLAVPVYGHVESIKTASNQVDGVQVMGTNADYSRIMQADFSEGRLFNDAEAHAGRPVIVLGNAVASALFPQGSPIGRQVRVNQQPFRVIGVLTKQGSFLGIFSLDNQALMPVQAYRKLFSLEWGTSIQVLVRDKDRMPEATEELEGAMRRVRGELPGERDSFSISGQQAFKAQLDPVKSGIAIAGLFITGLALFVGAIGIMNITFVSVKERTREIGTRKALGARRRTILLQFLIEAVAICVAGGAVGVALTFGLGLGLRAALPALPVVFSAGLVALSLVVAVLTGVISGFAPAWGASRLDPVEALRYE